MEVALDLNSVRAKLKQAIALRNKYVTNVELSDSTRNALKGDSLEVRFCDGVACVFGASDTLILKPRIAVEEFYKDVKEMLSIRSSPSVGTFCFSRLKLLQTKYELYLMANFDVEQQEQSSIPHRDFYNVRKVDTHVHHSACMNGKHLLRFIKKKLKTAGDDVVQMKDGKGTTLHQVFTSLGIGWGNLSLDKLNVVADQTVFHRFDRFNLKYNPMDQPELRTIFLKSDNDIDGRYLAEVTKEVLSDLEESKYSHVEFRLSIYGRRRDEWAKLAKWVLDWKLASRNNMWMIQIPRLYMVYRSHEDLANFQQMLDHIFVPMFEATLRPDLHPQLASFLSVISGFDSVDDESRSDTTAMDRSSSSRVVRPTEWDFVDNPPYSYYSFYLQANLKVLNQLRSARGLSTYSYRPHAGETGDLHHLDTTFLLADSINHGINLRKSMPLQYLYYLCQIGLAITPCSNNALFLSYAKTPARDFFMRGLNVSLGTDDPLQFHQTKEPLMEEYSIAKQFFRLSSADMCELARNSVLQSGFPDEVKARWIGSPDPTRNNIFLTNVPDARLQFRQRTLMDEVHFINDALDDVFLAYRSTIPSVPEFLRIGNGASSAPAEEADPHSAEVASIAAALAQHTRAVLAASLIMRTEEGSAVVAKDGLERPEAGTVSNGSSNGNKKRVASAESGVGKEDKAHVDEASSAASVRKRARAEAIGGQ